MKTKHKSRWVCSVHSVRHLLRSVPEEQKVVRTHALCVRISTTSLLVRKDTDCCSFRLVLAQPKYHRQPNQVEVCVHGWGCSCLVPFFQRSQHRLFDKEPTGHGNAPQNKKWLEHQQDQTCLRFLFACMLRQVQEFSCQKRKDFFCASSSNMAWYIIFAQSSLNFVLAHAPPVSLIFESTFIINTTRRVFLSCVLCELFPTNLDFF